MRHARVFAAALLIFGTMTAAGLGQVVLTNPITGTNPGASNPFNSGQTVAANLSASGIGRGSGIAASSATDRYSASGWNSPALGATDYFTWTLTPAADYQLTLTSFSYTAQVSGTGPTSFAFRSSLDSFSGNLGPATSTGGAITLSSGMFSGLTSPVEFRLYGWGASSGTGTFSVNDFTFNGTLSAVPEPSTYAAIAGVAGLAVALVRKRGRRRPTEPAPRV